MTRPNAEHFCKKCSVPFDLFSNEVIAMLGIGTVDGIAIAKTYLFNDKPLVFSKATVEDINKELRRLNDSLAAAYSQVHEIMIKAQSLGGNDKWEIFDFQLLILKDEDFINKIENKITEEKINCEYAVESVCLEYAALFSEMDNEYLNQRTGDILDIKIRIQCVLSGVPYKSLSGLSGEVILSAYDLAPSQTAELNTDYVKGILLEKGGKSSHTVILARSLGIPCIVGLDGLLNNLTNGNTIIMDGSSGEVIEDPTDSQIERYTKAMLEIEQKNKLLEKYKNCRSVTADGFEMKVYANITSAGEVAKLIENGGEGVGLLRTEFIYMASSSAPPSEKNQYEIYSEIAASLKGRPLVIRTLDAGGDKNIAYLGIEKEENPFLGYRAIRYCLDNKHIFKEQISAVLRAAVHGNIYMMFPMIADIEELRSAKAVVGETKADLEMNGVEYGEIRIGMMMETPAAAVSADLFAKEADFFSIGTNDLTQYLFAADRNNKKVAYLNSSFHPALLNTVYNICRAANKNNIEVDICGQAGEIPELVPLWAAMGVTNLSVSIPSVPLVRKIICQTNKQQAQKDLQEILRLDTSQEVIKFIKDRKREAEEY